MSRMRLTAVRSFFRYLDRHHALHNPALLAMRAPRFRKALPRPLSAGQAALLYEHQLRPERAAYNAAFPNRFAWKHAHSQRNPEADWGRHVVQSLQFGLWAINHQLAIKGLPPRGWADRCGSRTAGRSPSMRPGSHGASTAPTPPGERYSSANSP